MSDSPPLILCFGEILWDYLPAGLFPGGAPFNVGFHLHQLGARACVLSAVGRDKLGDELLRRLRQWDLDADTVEQHRGLPTGSVVARIDPQGNACYEITSSVAWDQITIGEDALRQAMEAHALVFGSLAQRSTFNQAGLDRLLSVLPESAWRVFDANLRPPHDDLQLIHRLADKATLLKANAAEAARLADGGSEQAGREEADARHLAERHDTAVCVTAGSRGAGLLLHDHWYWEPGRPVDTRDTIGAGDAFLAALLFGLIHDPSSPQTTLANACRLGEWVAGQTGATPPHPDPSPFLKPSSP